MGATHYTERVDEWGVGCVALELLLGASPFKGKPGHECTCPEVSHYNFNSDQVHIDGVNEYFFAQGANL